VRRRIEKTRQNTKLFCRLEQENWYYVVVCGPATISNRINQKGQTSTLSSNKKPYYRKKGSSAVVMVLLAPGLKSDVESIGMGIETK
jgi:hypothetical protein